MPIGKPAIIHFQSKRGKASVNANVLATKKLVPKIITKTLNIPIVLDPHELAGQGIIGDAFNKLSSWVSGKLSEIPKPVKDLLAKHGNKQIVNISVCRKPVQSYVRALLNIATLGKFREEQQKLGYDKVFHLYMNITLNDGSVVGLEKNERVGVKYGGFDTTGGECRSVPAKINLTEFFKKGEEHSGGGFWRYSGYKDNCQKWVNDLLVGNGITALSSFVLQNVEQLITNPTVRKLAVGITDLAGIADWALKGGKKGRGCKSGCGYLDDQKKLRAQTNRFEYLDDPLI